MLTRLEALRRGLTYFDADDPCVNCGAFGIRHTKTDHCSACGYKLPRKRKARPNDAEGDGRITSSSLLRSENPDMIIDKETAIALGFNCYRTGDPCKHGHRGWRSVSKDACIECKRKQSKR